VSPASAPTLVVGLLGRDDLGHRPLQQLHQPSHLVCDPRTQRGQRVLDPRRDGGALPEALAGVDVLLLVSGSEVGRRVAQHTAVIEAAKTAGVQRVAYTSIADADHSTNPLQPEHKATEDVLRASGLPFTIFRNNWYLENYTGQVPQYLATGEVLGIDGDARIGTATRADMAAAITAALLDEGTAGATFELSGPPITLAGLAEAVTDATDTKVAYRDVTPEELTAILRGTGLDDGTAGFVVALEESVARGDLDVRGDDIERLLGRPATTLADALRADHR
jgi:NAD(P)H dehydrogenase (quinone)